MPIDFFNLLAEEEGWGDMGVNQSSPRYFWNETAALLSEAPVDMEATFKGAMYVNSRVDPSFNMNGLRCRPGFTVPRHHHNLRELIIVFGGEFNVASGDSDVTRRVGAGEFWISEAGTPYTMTAGPEGVTYIETWPEPQSGLETTWHDVGWVHR
jgi:quercetin dioxygenase-like cupin family protein